MKNFTTWRPDTCLCEIVYSWDSEDPPESRKHTVHEVLKSCAYHQGTPDQCFDQVVLHNQTKNKAVAIVALHTGKKPQEIEWFVRDGKVFVKAPIDVLPKLKGLDVSIDG